MRGDRGCARIGILGGTFDPIHRGHLDVARVSHDALRLDAVWIVPSHVPPHRAQPVASPYHRFAMAALAVASEPDASWLQVSDIELSQAGPSFTALTLRRVTELEGEGSQIFFITGADAFAEIATWKDYPAILDLAHFVVVSRPGSPAGALEARLPQWQSRMTPADPERLPAQPSILLVDARTADVSSSDVRRRLASGQPLEGRVPAAVERHAIRHGLYRA
jgi:nicotinate-nucleotide adenylyltransferase